MIGELLSFWQKYIYMAHLNKRLGSYMFYYVTMCLGLVIVLYYYTLWQGFVGFAILFSAMAGVQIPFPLSSSPIDIVRAAGMLFIIRYTILGGLDAMAKKTPDNINQRLREIESKVGELHKLAFEPVQNRPEEHNNVTSHKAKNPPARR